MVQIQYLIVVRLHCTSRNSLGFPPNMEEGSQVKESAHSASMSSSKLGF